MNATRVIFRLVLALFAVAAVSSTGHAVCFVNGAAKGANDGSSWTDAYTNPQFALLKPDKCPEIWVARGVYKPTLGTDPSVSFVLPAGVTFYGGFIGDETSRDQRVPSVNLTVLSGDIDNNDTNAGGSEIDANFNDIHGANSTHVVYAHGPPSKPVLSSTLIDGFTITGGDAKGMGSGGGFYCDADGNERGECSPTLRNIIFSGNRADGNGGAMYNDASSGGVSSPTLIDVTFSGNLATGNGGAVYDNGDEGISSPTLINVFFSGNTASEGGAMYNLGADVEGGAPGVSNPSLSSVVFAGNSSQNGGAMSNVSALGGICSPTLNVVTFNGNGVRGFGGGAVFNGSDGSGSVTSPAMVNSTFNGNQAGNGGAMLNISSAGGSTRPSLLNVTFSGNSADSGGAIFNSSSGSQTTVLLTNVILWADLSSSDASENEIGSSDSTLLITQSVIEGGCPAGTVVCANVFTTDPKLGPLSENGGFTRTMVPQYGSSAIDTGLDAACPDVDQRGASRPQGAHCEIGAVEVIPTPPPVADPKSVVTPENTPIQITLSGSDSNPGGPFSFVVNTAVQFGSASLSGNIVTYTPSTNFTGFDSFLYSVTDRNGTSTPAKVTIQVTSIPPVAKSFSVNVPHNTTVSMKVSATDGNAGGPFAMTYAIVTSAATAHGTLSLSGDTAIYTPVHNYTGPDQYEYTATDVNGTSLPATVTIHVAPAPPIADDKSVTTPYNTPTQIILSGADNDNLGGPFALTFARTSSPSHGTVGAISGNSITYTPDHNYSGPDSFTYETTDVNGESKPALVRITVLPPGVVPPPPGNAVSVPTLGSWGMIALGGLFTLTAMRRKGSRD